MSRDRIEERGEFRYVRLKSGRLLSFWDARAAADDAFTALRTAVGRCFKLSSHDWDVDLIEEQLDEVDEWIAAMRHAVGQRRKEQRQTERIARLRDTTGRTPVEAKAFQRKADELAARREREGWTGWTR